MHPQFDERRISKCGKLIEALEECHRLGMVDRIFGACNTQKEALVLCLRQDRYDRQREHLEKSLQRNKEMRQKWKKIDEEEYGPGGYLREVEQKKKEGITAAPAATSNTQEQ